MLKTIAKNILKSTGLYGAMHRQYRAYLERKWQREYPSKRREIIKTYSNEHKYINIGGGNFLRSNWRILDYISPQYAYSHDLIDYNINLLRFTQWPIDNNSFDLAYTSHCFEHLTDAAGKHAFEETYRILKPGAIFRITVPDIDTAYNAYKRGDISFFIHESNARDKSSLLSQFLDFFTSYTVKDIDETQFNRDIETLSKEDFLNKYIPETIDETTHDFSAHITWYNFDKIKRMGEAAGFKKVVHSSRRNSISEEMRNAEFDHKPFKSCVYVDLVK